MSINLTCECGKKLRVNEDKIGKRVKCPGCQAILSVPAPEAEDEPEPPREPKHAPPPELEDEPEPPREAKSEPKPVDEEYEEEIEKPTKKKKPAPIDDESDEEKPSKDKKSAASSFGKIIVILGIGAFLLVGGGAAVVGALWYFDALPIDNRPTNAAKGPPKGAGPDNKGEKPDIIEPKVRFTADLGKEGDARKVANVLLSRDGRRAAISNGGLKAQIWDLAAEPKKMHDLDGAISAMSPDGKRLVLNKKDGRFLVDCDSGAELGKVPYGGFTTFQSNTVFWTIEPFLGLKQKWKVMVRSYDANTGKKDKEIEIDKKGDRFFGLTEKGEIIFVSESTGAHVWDVATEKWTRQTAIKTVPGEKLSVSTTFAVSPDGKWLVAHSGKDPTIFDLSTGDFTKINKHIFFPHNPVFVPNRDILMGSGSKETKKYYAAAFDVKGNSVEGKFGTVESITTLAVSADGNTLAAGTWEGEVAIWDVKKLD